MKKLIILTGIIIISLPNIYLLQAQTEALDSLNNSLNLTFDKFQRMKILNQIAYELRLRDPEKSKKLVEEVLDLARHYNNKEEIAYALYTKGLLLNNSGEYFVALNYYREALSIYQELKKKKDIARLFYSIGFVYKTVGNYQISLENCLAGLKIYEELGDNTGKSLIYRVMGSIYKYKGDYVKSLFYYSKGLIINEESGNLPELANSYNNIGIVYFMMKDFEKALDYYRRSLKINLSENIESEKAINLGNIGEVYLELNELDSALYYINKSHNAALLMKNRKGIANSMEAYGNYYFRIKNFTKAVDNYTKALRLSRELGILEISKSLLKSLSDLYLERSDYLNAFTYYKSYINLTDSLINNDNSRRIEQMEIQYAFEKEKAIHQLSDQKKKFYRIIGFSILLSTILFLIIIFMGLRIKLKRRILEQRSLEKDKQKLQSEIHIKNKELVSKAIHLAEKNEFLGDLTQKLYQIIYAPGDGTNAIKNIIKDLKFHSDTQIWNEFEYTFLKVHPDYFNTLGKKFPDLTPNEKRLSAFLILNLSTKEISNITHQSFHSLTVARTRLRKKLGLANTGENLTSFLSQFLER